MEKYSQYRDRGSGIAPFFPIHPQPSGIYLPFHFFLFALRIIFLIPISLFYFIILSWLPAGSFIKKTGLWTLIGISGIWWVDLQIDGVRRGSLAKQNPNRLPGPSTVIASSFTSPLDCVYLAVIFNPIFTASYPTTRKVRRLSLFQAMLRAFQPPQTTPPKNARLTTLAQLIRENPDACIVALPECTTTNGRGILPFSPSLLTLSPKTRIFPVSLRYTPSDITTPIPHSYLRFLWNLCSKPQHSIRVRIAEAVYNTSALDGTTGVKSNTFDTNIFEDDQFASKLVDVSGNSDDDDDDTLAEELLTEDEQAVLSRVAEDLARLGRVKRLALGVKEKQSFVDVFVKKKRPVRSR